MGKHAEMRQEQAGCAGFPIDFSLFFSPRQGPAKVAAKSCWQPPRPQTAAKLRKDYKDLASAASAKICCSAPRQGPAKVPPRSRQGPAKEDDGDMRSKASLLFTWYRTLSKLPKGSNVAFFG